ncbi:hypothetical protein M0R45_008352 [Rubus argutus]|uniref:Uncharacterized protein n=1 Tax=Rubus argutus TaxID=59490 RepID=A0AAW1Y2G6_RUBAR
MNHHYHRVKPNRGLQSLSHHHHNHLCRDSSPPHLPCVAPVSAQPSSPSSIHPAFAALVLSTPKKSHPMPNRGHLHHHRRHPSIIHW